MAELNHRVKNMLAPVQAVASQTLRGTRGHPAKFASDLNGRLRALARTHALMTAVAWEAADLDAVTRAALAPWLDAASAGCRIDLSHDLGTGQAARLSPTQAQTLSLALHELATNAAKHGALSGSKGRIVIACHGEPGGGVGLEWLESGRPPVTGVATRRGFGTRLPERALARDQGAGAAVAPRFEQEGLRATIRFTPWIGAAG